eukprot:8730612-Pyramimonas_sp.AAC.1
MCLPGKLDQRDGSDVVRLRRPIDPSSCLRRMREHLHDRCGEQGVVGLVVEAFQLQWSFESFDAAVVQRRFNLLDARAL